MDDATHRRLVAGCHTRRAPRFFSVLLSLCAAALCGCQQRSAGLLDELDDWQREAVIDRRGVAPPGEAGQAGTASPSLPPAALAADALAAVVPAADAAGLDASAAPLADSAAETTANATADPDPLTLRLTVEASEVRADTLLLALARDAGLELQLHSPIGARVTLRMVDRSLSGILNRLAQQVPLYWQLQGRRLEIRGDEPYSASYPVNYLNLDRQLESRLGLATRVGSINGDASDGGTANGSETRLSSRASQQFWDSLTADIDALIGAGRRGTAALHTLNRDAGLVTLHARPPLHQRVREHLAAIERRSKRQVLIEATVVEVDLTDEYAAGVDWQAIARAGSGISALQNLSGLPLLDAESAARTAAPAALLGLSQSRAGVDMHATLQLLEEYGSVRIVSRPRVLALNNQPAVLKVVDNRVYFTLNVQRRQSDDVEQLTTDTQIHTVPVGLVMNVTPFIGAGDDVMLSVRPTLSRILGVVNDPNPALAQARISNVVPEIQVREMESLLRVPNGQLAAIGGLIQERQRQGRAAVPLIQRLPLFGKLFQRRSDSQRRTELLLLIRPTIVPLESGTHAADDRLAARGDMR